MQQALWQLSGRRDPAFKVSGLMTQEPTFTRLFTHQTWNEYTGRRLLARWWKTSITWRYSTILRSVLPVSTITALWAYMIAGLPGVLLPRTSPVPQRLSDGSGRDSYTACRGTGGGGSVPTPFQRAAPQSDGEFSFSFGPARSNPADKYNKRPATTVTEQRLRSQPGGTLIALLSRSNAPVPAACTAAPGLRRLAFASATAFASTAMPQHVALHRERTQEFFSAHMPLSFAL